MTKGQPAPLLDKIWTRVDAFDPRGPTPASRAKDAMAIDGEDDYDSDEWEHEDTEHLVTLDLGSESKRLLQMSHQYSITGLETDTPYLRLGNVIFKGHWDQLIGTEILLRDQKDLSRGGGGGGGGGVSAAAQHDVQPLPPSQSDLRTGKAPSTTRTRIQFKPAVNMIARENALKEKATTKEMQSIKYKNWVWVKGKGWVRKEQLNSLKRLAADGDNEPKSDEEEVEFKGKKVGRKVMTIEDKLGQGLLKSLRQISKDRNGMESVNAADDDDEGGEEGDEGNGDEDEDVDGSNADMQED